MSATKHEYAVWGDPALQLQIFIRKVSGISVLFSLAVAVFNQESHWWMITGLAIVYIFYNASLCLRQVKPHLQEFFVNLALCAGFTVSGAMYSSVLYHLLLVRMVLKVGGRRAVRMMLVIALVYVTAQVFASSRLSTGLWFEIIYNTIGFVMLTLTAVYMRNVVEVQSKNEGQIAELMRENAHHYELAHTDQLTGLLNHRAYLEKTADLQQYILVIIDIDYFKKLNDTHGHLFGDQVLETIGRMIKQSIRSKDMAFRYGGEEFALVLPGTSLDLGLKIAERLRFQVANSDFIHHGERVNITISIGVARKSPSVACQDAFREADSALYRAKRQGRNQCAVF
ncbi:GGDEF domain-containing protein [Sporomusa acidovorans]|uniref:GGDEF domain-containing protein n=1 Tax=Sporomusa acidovorans (strain ATCC 49682 / DSM 3132 / Mol) TaxID=1123286 RepID=A0ABZ3J9M8_SPOA4|nr:diguanylate cyclase [Sporomusa acidovorans]OZC22926.1 response regulator PleD [Sporomusa acidovorans DSM 3132]SDE94952.1 diguanylate cyclase (GGDEF) domain-containing protein [Sporomusa acidovorans]